MTSDDIKREVLIRTNPFGLMRAVMGAQFPEEFYQKLFESGMRHAAASLLEGIADEVKALTDQEDRDWYVEELKTRAKELRR